MDELINEITEIAEQCEKAAKIFESEPLVTLIRQLYDAITSIEDSWSGSYLGYHAYLYLNGLHTPNQGEFFDNIWGLTNFSNTRGDWRKYEYDEIEKEIYRRAHVSDLTPIEKAAEHAAQVFYTSKQTLLPIMNAVTDTEEKKSLFELRNQLVNLQNCITIEQLFRKRTAGLNIYTRDQKVFNQGLVAPHHTYLELWLREKISYNYQTTKLAEIAQQLKSYLEIKSKIEWKPTAKTEEGLKNLVPTVNNYIQGDQHMGDKFDMSGNFQGSMINIKSRLTNVTQSIGTLPDATQEAKQEFTQLLSQLRAALETVPAECVDDATKVAKRVEALVDEVKENKPDEEEIKTRGESLKKAAENLAGIVPIVLNIVTQIVSYIPKLLGK